MLKVETTVQIERPSEEVFAYISNFENNPEWQSGQLQAKFTSDSPLQVGSTYMTRWQNSSAGVSFPPSKSSSMSLIAK